MVFMVNSNYVNPEGIDVELIFWAKF